LVETACRQAPPELHDGIWRAVYDNLAGKSKGESGTYVDKDVSMAVQRAFADNGLKLVKLYYCGRGVTKVMSRWMIWKFVYVCIASIAFLLALSESVAAFTWA